jgi:hypothetical protein
MLLHAARAPIASNPAFPDRKPLLRVAEQIYSKCVHPNTPRTPGMTRQSTAAKSIHICFMPMPN